MDALELLRQAKIAFGGAVIVVGLAWTAAGGRSLLLMLFG